MLYSLYDKFIVDGILCQVRYINHGKAWVSPVDDADADAGEGKTHYTFITMAVLDEKGRDRNGRKALVVTNIQSGAV